MKKQRNQRGNRIRLIPLLLGGYAVYLGFGLTVIGLSEREAGVGIARLMMGLAILGFGLLGLWDGVWDYLAPRKRAEKPPARQFILTDTEGKQTSNVTPALLEAQLAALIERSGGAGFRLQLLPALEVPEKGSLGQVFCICQESIALLAFFEAAGEEAPQVWRTEPEDPAQTLGDLLEDRLDLTGWERAEIALQSRDVSSRPRQHMALYGESWENHLQFFSVRDVELAVKGIGDGRYRGIRLELGSVTFYAFPSGEDASRLVLQFLFWPEGKLRAFERIGNAVQVNFWLMRMLNEGLPRELQGWREVTDTIKM